MSRILSAAESEMYGKFAGLMPEGSRAPFHKQLPSIRVVREDPSRTTFDLSGNAEPIDAAAFNYYLSGFYDDQDGEIVSVILHFIPPGYISWVERFRLDHQAVQNPLSSAKSLRFIMDRGPRSNSR